MAKLRLGVIGAGSWAVASHLPNLAKHGDEVEFVGVARKGPELLGKIRDQYGFKVASEDYRDVIDAGVDIVVVASPTGLHHEHAKAALEAGAHVMCEKPVTIDPAQAWDLVETAKRLDRELIISFGWNYLPMMKQAKQLMEDVGIGRLEHLTIHMQSCTRELLSNTGAYPGAAPEAVPEQATWTDPSLSGGGYGQAQLCHALGFALWLADARVESAYAILGKGAFPDAPVELHDAVALTYEGGVVGTMSGASCHIGAYGNKHGLEMRAMGSDGQVAVDLEREWIWLYRPDGTDLRPDLPEDAGLYNCDGPIEALVDAGMGRLERNWSPGELGARTVEVLDLLYRSARSGQLESRV
jgi:predicted dehydrogenase